ncbi:MAG: helix-turn-helix transcriptional regulator [Nitrospirae bacterium]|nr:MAG: helix-turn-helix transcriptional regulator [Nitrospirota bacterium]
MDVNEPSREHREPVADQRACLGIAVLSSALKLLHLNRRAADLFDHINRAESGVQGKDLAQGILPAAVTTLCAEILNLLRVRTHGKDWEQVEEKRLVSNSTPPMILRGFGLPDQRGPEHARIVITVEEIGRKQYPSLDQAGERFRLTEREQAVVEHLIKGWTNKEIAANIGVAEQTVKEHIKHIMGKTGSTTRTGLLVKILQPWMPLGLD